MGSNRLGLIIAAVVHVHVCVRACVCVYVCVYVCAVRIAHHWVILPCQAPTPRQLAMTSTTLHCLERCRYVGWGCEVWWSLFTESRTCPVCCLRVVVCVCVPFLVCLF